MDKSDVYDKGFSSKNREAEDDAIAAFLNQGGSIDRVPDSKKMGRIRRSKKNDKKRLEQGGIEMVMDLSDF